MKKVPDVMTGESQRVCSTDGFTIIELLIAIMIVGILCVLAASSYTKAKEGADATICLSNLRQIGMAVQAYASEHTGVLPGSMAGHQRATVSGTSIASTRSQLIDYVAPYLAFPPLIGSQSYTSPLFCCPSALKALRKEGRNVSSPLTYVHLGTWLAADKMIRAFGYKQGGNETIAPSRLANLDSPGLVMALIDSDEDLSPAPSAPSHPAHGTVRHILYIDGHVRAVPVRDLEFRSNHLYIKP